MTRRSSAETDLADLLVRPSTIRRVAADVVAWLREGAGSWRVDLTRIADAADLVTEVTRRRYPDGHIPLHGRELHLRGGPADTVARRHRRLAAPSSVERRRQDIEVVIVSVLLDGGAGPHWRFTDPDDGTELARSEGLAVASFHAYVGGLFASDGGPRADAAALAEVTAEDLRAAFGPGLIGLDARAAVLRGLGRRLDELGHSRLSEPFEGLEQRVDATRLLRRLVDLLGPAFAAGPHGFGPTIGGRRLGDVWFHPALVEGPTAGWVPFHKLAQWCAYSLVAPLTRAGHEVAGLDALTALAEYRNGGLLIDVGVLEPRDPTIATRRLLPGDRAVIEWRAATVELIDRVADGVRARLGRPDLGLGAILEGGTWAAGRELARARAGEPPLRVDTGGIVF